MKAGLVSYALLVALCLPHLNAAERASPLSALGKLPVREITVFKDGHVFVAHQGALPVDAEGNVAMDYLPTPIIGTFWPYSADNNAKLGGVTARQRRVLVQRTALNIRELLEANIGAQAFITEINTNHYAATIVGFPIRTAEELESTAPRNSDEKLPERGNIVLLRTPEGTKAVPIERIQDVTFRDDFKPVATNEEFRHLLTLKLDWGGRNPAKACDVGLFYVQKGIRWIPSYKVTLDGKGGAVLKLQATILNELTDFEDANVNLVIGVPTFAFKDTIDPVALQQTAAQLSQYFNDNRDARGGILAGNFSNAIMTQSGRMSEYRQTPSNPPAEGQVEGDQNEDLFVFNIKRLSLKKGERIVVPVVEYAVSYEDIFMVDLPFAPPPEVHANFNSSQQQELARLFNAPKVMHKVRLTNKSTYPLTTAPALIVRDERVLAQGMMTYTAPGGQSDLAVTAAVNVGLKKTESETDRTADAVKHDSSFYTRVRMSGKLTLTNHRRVPVKVEVSRYVLGTVDKADRNGAISKINTFENDEFGGSSAHPYWWGWYGWPSWWSHFNGVARIKWETELPPGKSTELGYDWHYFWR